jgi:uncharacterized protein (DUF885 family)
MPDQEIAGQHVPSRAALLAAASLLVGCAAIATSTDADPPASRAAAAALAPEGQHDRLYQLFHESDEAHLRRNPIDAMFRGDYRYADRLGNNFSDEYHAAERAAAEQDLTALAAIDRDALDPTDRLAYDVFKFQREDALADVRPELLALTAVRPLNHFYGWQTFYPTFASGRNEAPFRDVRDYNNNVLRHIEYVQVIDAAIGRFREGLESGVVETKLTIGHVIDQLETQLAMTPEESPYCGPAQNFPEAVPQAERARLRQELVTVVRDSIYPAHRRLRDFLQDEYLPRAREGVGLVHMPGGDILYRRLIEKNTTLPLTADDVHDLGLREVARIRGEMEAIGLRVGFRGTLAQFFEHLRTDRRFEPPSREWLRDRYDDIGRRVDARVREIFSTVPRTRLEIRAVEPFRETTFSGASYRAGTPDGSRPGVFYYNTYDLPSRRTYWMETDYLHEAVPGHHFQFMLASENAALPGFMRFVYSGAYAEGWALYAETLWDELGMETDPYQRFGGLDGEMLRAMRLVVDSGIHSKGWTREQAIRYMLDNSGLGETEVIREVERYIAIPGQALSYKIGQLKMLELRARAEQALRGRFDLRDFHDQVLMTGYLPLTVLEQKIDEWIASRGAN